MKGGWDTPAIKIDREEVLRWLAELERQPATEANRAIIDYLRGDDLSATKSATRRALR